MENKKLYSLYKDLSQKELNDEFIEACKTGTFKKIKYLLTSPDLDSHADIHVKDDEGFRLSCLFGNVEVVKYLLTSKDLKEHSNIDAQKDAGLIMAAQFGNLDIIKYLLTSSDLKECADMYSNNSLAFNEAYNINNLSVVQFLIFDMNIIKNNDIEMCLKRNPKIEVENMFKLREINESLNNELSSYKINNKKIKV